MDDVASSSSNMMRKAKDGGATDATALISIMIPKRRNCPDEMSDRNSVL